MRIDRGTQITTRISAAWDTTGKESLSEKRHRDATSKPQYKKNTATKLEEHNIKVLQHHYPLFFLILNTFPVTQPTVQYHLMYGYGHLWSL
jgi:hypothetical protein